MIDTTNRLGLGPIGVFDSGVGGLTVLAAIRAAVPDADLVYIADQAHVPYGERRLDEIRSFAAGIVAGLVSHGCSSVVMACNISSAVALADEIHKYPGVPVVGVLEPGARMAAEVWSGGPVGVLATSGTVRSGAYARAIGGALPGTRVIELACPEFVPLVEAGVVNGAAVEDAARPYIRTLAAEGVSTVVLGCTHYPYLSETLKKLAPAMRFVDPAEATAQLVAARLSGPPDEAAASRVGHATLATTGDREAFSRQVDHLSASLGPRTVVSASWKSGAAGAAVVFAELVRAAS